VLKDRGISIHKKRIILLLLQGIPPRKHISEKRSRVGLEGGQGGREEAASDIQLDSAVGPEPGLGRMREGGRSLREEGRRGEEEGV
jgi:hypothetical protein